LEKRFALEQLLVAGEYGRLNVPLAVLASAERDPSSSAIADYWR
jgi:hypothetical protein